MGWMTKEPVVPLPFQQSSQTDLLSQGGGTRPGSLAQWWPLVPKGLARSLLDFTIRAMLLLEARPQNIQGPKWPTCVDAVARAHLGTKLTGTGAAPTTFFLKKKKAAPSHQHTTFLLNADAVRACVVAGIEHYY